MKRNTTTPTTKLGSTVHSALTPKREGRRIERSIAARAEYKLYIGWKVPYSLRVMMRTHSLSTGLLVRQRLTTTPATLKRAYALALGGALGHSLSEGLYVRRRP
jgi:hypothetical protein